MLLLVAHEREVVRVIVQTARLELRPFQESDFPALRAFDADPAVWEYRGGQVPTEAQTRAALQRYLNAAHEQPPHRYPFAIILRAAGRFIGECGLKITNHEAAEAELYYGLIRSAWRQGYMTEAGAALIAFGFTDLGLHRLWAKCDPDHRDSWRVMEKLGMQREGQLRECVRTVHGWRDRVVYAILNHERMHMIRSAA